ncbi:hypothetical protein RJ639_031323 [Escallonia herrerae]|uniref:RING-type domain-containing protein n=1 Tax=Escallonia herrerae TaxID=1293975 RepID=A0AA88XCP1_9ASTE|nr:hypothetical protein RJ639_031323 [Escallonia herrerae]
MWSFVKKFIASIGLKKCSIEPSPAGSEYSDDEICSNASEEGLECPICWESFNIVENVPYVLWCGHTLCKHCLLALQWATLKFSTQQIQIPFFVSCPWCHLLTLRLVYKGNVKFPCKNFFLLWMVESFNGDRMKSRYLIPGEHQPIWSPGSTSLLRNRSSNTSDKRPYCLEPSGSNRDHSNGISDYVNLGRPHLAFHKSLDLFIHCTAKFPLVIILLLVVIFGIPASAAILTLYMLITVLFALPSFVVLYFAYPALDWLAKEITA